jgi:hypothetical protein
VGPENIVKRITAYGVDLSSFRKLCEVRKSEGVQAITLKMINGWFKREYKPQTAEAEKVAKAIERPKKARSIDLKEAAEYFCDLINEGHTDNDKIFTEMIKGLETSEEVIGDMWPQIREMGFEFYRQLCLEENQRRQKEQEERDLSPLPRDDASRCRACDG